MEYIEYESNLDRDSLKIKNIFIDEKSKVADGVKIGVNVCVINSTIKANCTLNSNSMIEDSIVGENSTISSSQISNSEVGDNCTIGPFAHIRSNSKLGNNIRVGNFVEIKNSFIGNGSKMAHLSYIGDAEIGANCNIGCGVVFCNYNGKLKQKIYVGDNVFIGSNANLIAPIRLEDSAFVAAGSTINKDVSSGELAIARERQYNTKNFKNPYLDTKNR